MEKKSPDPAKPPAPHAPGKTSRTVRQGKALRDNLRRRKKPEKPAV